MEKISHVHEDVICFLLYLLLTGSREELSVKRPYAITCFDLS